MERAKIAEGATWLQWRKTTRKKHGRKRKGRRRRRRRKRSKTGENCIIEEVIRSSQRRALEECCLSERKRTEGQNPIQRWDCSQIENEEEEESGQGGDQMAEQWEEEQHLDDIVESIGMEGSSLKLDVVQKVPELVVTERMSQGEKVKETKEKKKVP